MANEESGSSRRAKALAILFLCLGPIALEHFHIACVRRCAIEDFRSDRIARHYLCKVCIFEVAYPTPPAFGRKVPQPSVFRFELKAVKNF